MTYQKYILDENHNHIPVDLMTWGRWFGDIKNRRVAEDKIGKVKVSTVFMGTDHNFSDDGPPLLYETMIFGGKRNDEQERYSTWDEAIAGHKRIVKEITNE